MFEHFWNIMKLYICCHSWKDKEIQRGPSLLNKNQKVCIQLQVCSDCISLNLQQWESLNSCWKAQPDHVSCEGRHRRPMGGREASWGAEAWTEMNMHWGTGCWTVVHNMKQMFFCLVWFVLFYLLLFWHCNTYICIAAYSSNHSPPPTQPNPTQ